MALATSSQGCFSRYVGGLQVVCGRSVADARARISAISARIQSRAAVEAPGSAGRFAVDEFVAPIGRDHILGADLPPLAALLSSLDQVRAQQEARKTRSRGTLLRSASVQFQPAAARVRSVVLNRCFLDVDEALHSGRLHFDAPTARLVARIDQMLLTRAVERLHRAMSSVTSDALLLVPVHYSTVRDTACSSEYQQLFERIPLSYSRLIHIEVVLDEAHEPPLHLRATLHDVQRYCPRLFLRLPDCDWRLIKGAHTALRGVSCHLRGCGGAPDLSRRLQRLTMSAKAVDLVTCATGADTLGLAIAARKAGFDFIIGTAISGTLDEPRLRASLLGLGEAAA